MSAERRYLDSHEIDIKKLWKIAADKPVLVLPLTVFKAIHKKKYWSCKLGEPISAYEVLQDPSRAPEHVKKTQKADLSFPIILAESNLDILDGLHRLNKSMALGRTEIKAQLISLRDLELCFGVGI